MSDLGSFAARSRQPANSSSAATRDGCTASVDERYQTLRPRSRRRRAGRNARGWDTSRYVLADRVEPSLGDNDAGTPPRLRRDGGTAPGRDGPPPAEIAARDRFREIPSGTGSARPSRREAVKRGMLRHRRRTATASARQRAATGWRRDGTLTEGDAARGPGKDIRRRPFGAIGGVRSTAGNDRDGQESSRRAGYLRIPGGNPGICCPWRGRFDEIVLISRL